MHECTIHKEHSIFLGDDDHDDEECGNEEKEEGWKSLAELVWMVLIRRCLLGVSEVSCRDACWYVPSSLFYDST